MTIRMRPARAASLAAFATVALLAGAGAARAQNAYLTLDAGDQAVYSTFTSTANGQVTNQVRRTSGHWREHAEFAGFGAVWLWPSTSTNRAWVWTAQSGTQLFADFEAVGTSQTVELRGVRGTVTVGAIGEPMAVPGGTFDCTRLDFAGFGAGLPERAWFARDVGCVRWEGRGFEGVLANGTIGGVSYPRPVAGTRVSVIAPEQGWANAMPGPGPRPTPRIQVSGTIANDSTDDVQIVTQASRPTIRVEIVDAAGVVRTSQAPRIRIMVVQTDLKPGQSLTTTFDVDLVDDSSGTPGAWLPAGQYTLRVKLGDKYSHEQPFHMGWAF